MTKLYNISLKDGTSLQNAMIFYRDSKTQIILKDAEQSEIPGSTKKYSLLWTCPDQIAVSKAAPGTKDAPQFPQLTPDQMQKKAQKNAQARQMHLLRLSGQIDEFAMRLFMALSKTVPCKWYFEEQVIKDQRARPTAIVVFDELVINPPYNQQDIYPTPGAAPATVEWIGKVICREREKLLMANQ